MIRLILAILFLFVSGLRADHEVDIEARIAAFLPQSNTFREIYGRASPSYQVEATMPIWECFSLWVNASYLPDRGQSDPLEDRSNLDIFTMSGGLKYLYCLTSQFSVYGGIGINYGWLKEKKQMGAETRITRENGVGGTFKLGLLKTAGCFVSSVFVDYQIQQLPSGNTTGSEKANNGGTFLGCSIGVRF